LSGAVAAVIPARLGSTRLPKKPLLRETGKFLIQHVVERVQRARTIDRVIVATDAPEIHDAVTSFGAEAWMTSKDHPTGTDRIAEVVRSLDAEYILNVQGDEPEIDPNDLDSLASALIESGAEMATLAAPFDDLERFRDRNAVKVVVDREGNALYFSRSQIPWCDPTTNEIPSAARKHVGVYGFRRATLLRFASLPPCEIEQSERLEQLRALHHRIAIRVVDITREPIGIDTPDDYRRFVERHGAMRTAP